MKRIGLLLCIAALSAVAAPQVRAADDPAVAVKKTLKNPAVSGSLRDAFDKIERLGGVMIVPEWGLLKSVGVKPTDKVTVSARKATVGQLLDMVLVKVQNRKHPLAWKISDGLISVTTQQRILAGRTSIRRAGSSARAGKQGAPAARPRRRNRPGLIKTLEFSDIPLKDVVQFLRDFSGLNIHVNWRSLQVSNITQDTNVTLKAKNVSVAKALDMVTSQLSPHGDKFDRIYWVVDEGIVRIATGTVLNSESRTEVIDVGDLLAIAPNFKGPRIDLESDDRRSDTDDTTAAVGGGGLFEEDEEDEYEDELTPAEQRKKLRENLVEAIKSTIGDEMWRPNGKGSIKWMGKNRLVISQTLLGWKLMGEASR